MHERGFVRRRRGRGGRKPRVYSWNETGSAHKETEDHYLSLFSFFPFSIIFLSTSSTFQVKLTISSSQKRIKPIPRRIQDSNPSIAKIFRDYFLRRIVFVLSPTRDLRNTSSQFHTDPVPPSRYPGPLNAADKEQSTLIKTMPTRG